MRGMVVVQSNAKLFEVVPALYPPGRFTSRLNRGQKQSDQDGDDRDHDQQLDKGKSRPFRR